MSSAGAACRTAAASRSGPWSRSSATQPESRRTTRRIARWPRILGLVGDHAVTDRIAAAVGLSDAPVPLTEVFWAVQRLVGIMAERGPVVLVFDDIHWAEPTLLELIEHLTRAEMAVPVLIVCTARNDLLETHPDVGPGHARGPDRAWAAGCRARG